MAGRIYRLSVLRFAFVVVVLWLLWSLFVCVCCGGGGGGGAAAAAVLWLWSVCVDWWITAAAGPDA